MPRSPRLLGTILVLAFLVLPGCDSNPDGPRVPPQASSAGPAEGPAAPGKPARRPVTRNPREIVNPE